MPLLTVVVTCCRQNTTGIQIITQEVTQEVEKLSNSQGFLGALGGIISTSARRMGQTKEFDLKEF